MKANKNVCESISEGYFKIQYCVGKSINGTFFFANDIWQELCETVKELFYEEIENGETIESIIDSMVILYEDFDSANDGNYFSINNNKKKDNANYNHC